MIGFDSSAERRGFWRGVLCGLAAAGVVAMCMAPPAARALGTEDGPAFAVATARDGSTITLHTGRGQCVGEARAAFWRPARGSDAAPVPGCWIAAPGAVLVSFLDGERADIPASMLVKLRSG